MTGWKRWFYHNMGWVYDPTETTEETKRQRHELMIQIKSFNDNIRNAVLREEGEIPTTARAVVEADYVRPSTKIKATRCPTPTPRGLVGFDAKASTIDLGELYNHDDYLDGTECDSPKTIQEYTALFEGFEIPPKRKRKRKKNSNKLNF